jgi:DNA-binding Lrp family transcriptional regulator
MKFTEDQIVEILQDIRLGMDQARLSEKYNLSKEVVNKLFRRLIERGLL